MYPSQSVNIIMKIFTQAKYYVHIFINAVRFSPAKNWSIKHVDSCTQWVDIFFLRSILKPKMHGKRNTPSEKISTQAIMQQFSNFSWIVRLANQLNKMLNSLIRIINFCTIMVVWNLPLLNFLLQFFLYNLCYHHKLINNCIFQIDRDH